MKFFRKFVVPITIALILITAAALANEYIGECDDCCGVSTCDDCVLCWCCSAVPAVITTVRPQLAVVASTDVVRNPACPDIESHNLELLDPPPRS